MKCGVNDNDKKPHSNILNLYKYDVLNDKNGKNATNTSNAIVSTFFAPLSLTLSEFEFNIYLSATCRQLDQL